MLLMKSKEQSVLLLHDSTLDHYPHRSDGSMTPLQPAPVSMRKWSNRLIRWFTSQLTDLYSGEETLSIVW